MAKVWLKVNFVRILLFGCICICPSLSAQKPQKQNLKKDVEEIMYSNPNQALKIAELLLNTSTVNNEEKAKINLLIAKTYFVKGDFGASLKSLYLDKNKLNYLTSNEQVELNVLEAAILRNLSLYKESVEALNNSEKLLQKISDKNALYQANSYVQIEKAKYYVASERIDEALELLQKIDSGSKAQQNTEVSLMHNLALARLFYEKKDFTKSKDFYTKALLLTDRSKAVNLFAKTIALSGLASVYFLEKEHQKAGLLLDESLKNSDLISNLYLKEIIIRQQIINYLALKDTANYKKANKEFNTVNRNADLLEEEATNIAYNLISKEYTSTYETDEANFFSILYDCIAVVLVAIFGALFFWWRNHQKERGLNEIIRYLEITQNNFINRFTEKEIVIKKLPKRNPIPQETEKAILAKLQRFESSTRYTSKEISLAVLAAQFDTNTKYLSEIINTHFHVNFNTYINKLRINYLVEKLKSDPNYIHYKISYLADDCGFASHSNFATVFKSITGISPVTFIELLKEDKLVIAV